MLFATALFSTLCGAAALHKYREQQAMFFPKRAPIELPAAASQLAGAVDVSFSAAGAQLKGWYVPSKNGAAVILAHGAGGNRAALLPEAQWLEADGFGVLLFDWPGHGASSGTIHWNEAERASLRAALDWLSNRPDISRGRIGAFGFSMGGYVVAQVAATDQRLAGVVLASTPADQRKQVKFQHGKWWLLGEWPALFALRRGGMEIARAKPIDVVARIAPRPVMLLGASNDFIVPPGMASELYDRAGEPKELLMVEGAGHGEQASVGGENYRQRLLAFLRGALLARKS